MEKLTVMTFTKNYIKNALELIQWMYDVADEFILVDSSNKENRELLASEKKRLKLNKLKVYTAPALGYPDPLRMYAISKCTSNWVTLLDSDERFPPKLKKDVKGIITKTDCDAFAIKRYETIAKKNAEKFFTWQIRLFKRDKVSFTGLRHEQGLVD